MKDNHQNQIKLSQLRILVAVAEQETFSEAALYLDMSQSAVSHSIAIHLLPDAIAQFKQHYPDIVVNLSEHDNYRQVERALRDGRADIDFTLLPTGDEFDTWEILENAYVALFPPAFKPTGATLTWAELGRRC